ncbi:Transcription elongation factor GreA [Phycisphaerae bacterium RAS1]|nr:Transcription elongation factor GreA [Phycisphaerae bacterium RAS1]
MPQTQLLELAKSGNIEAFEARCLELITSGALHLADLVKPFQQLQKSKQTERAGALAQVVLENVDAAADPRAALHIARAAWVASPKDEKTRQLVVDLLTRCYADRPGFALVLEGSGITTGRAPRSALKYIDYCFDLKPGDVLHSRMDDRVVEVHEVDPGGGIVVIRRDARLTTLPVAELAREYDQIDPDDFRVLQQLRPERLNHLLNADPAALVIGLIRAHGRPLDADTLRAELVPKVIKAAQWSKWWTSTRSVLKRNPHVAMEGRSPVVLTYSEEAQTIEDDTWAQFEAQSDPDKWQATIESYFREKQKHNETADAALLQRVHDHLFKYAQSIRTKRAAEAVCCGLVIDRLAGMGLPATPESRGLAAQMLREAREPTALIRNFEDDAFWEGALLLLPTARPDDYVDHFIALIASAPAARLDTLVGAALKAGRADAVQAVVDASMADLVRSPEVIYWLWKGPKSRDGLKLPSSPELLIVILEKLSALLKHAGPPTEAVKQFRARIKAALSLKDFAQVRSCFEKIGGSAAITVRRQLERLEGLGDNAPYRMLDILREIHPELWIVKQERIERWSEENTLWCTADGLKKRTAERDAIVNVEMRDNARRIGEAASLGDLSENSEYKFALEERDLLRARLARVNEELSVAQTFQADDVPEDHVGIGSRVLLRNTASAETREMTMFGPFEADVERGIFSYKAPFCQKLMGLKVGERAAIPFDGRDQEFEIVQIENGMRSA